MHCNEGVLLPRRPGVPRQVPNLVPQLNQPVQVNNPQGPKRNPQRAARPGAGGNLPPPGGPPGGPGGNPGSGGGGNPGSNPGGKPPNPPNPPNPAGPGGNPPGGAGGNPCGGGGGGGGNPGGGGANSDSDFSDEDAVDPNLPPLEAFLHRLVKAQERTKKINREI